MFSKVRLRNQARSSIMRRGPFGGDRAPGGAPGTGWPRGFGAAARLDSQAKAEEKDPLFLIRQEVAIMKKLDHPHLVQLIEVLDDPLEDSLYMVLEMCKRGVIMDVGLGKAAQPYDEKTCRRWFRHLILAIEYCTLLFFRLSSLDFSSFSFFIRHQRFTKKNGLNPLLWGAVSSD